MTGIELITKERLNQIDKGRTAEYDKQYNTENQLVEAVEVLCMDLPEEMIDIYIEAQGEYPPVEWDKEAWTKLIKKPYKEKLVIAGALIAAEIDRIS